MKCGKAVVGLDGYPSLRSKVSVIFNGKFGVEEKIIRSSLQYAQQN